MPSSPRRNATTRFGTWPVTLLCVLLGIQILVTIGATRADDLTWFDPLVDVREMILEDHVGSPDTDAMQEAAITGMLETLGDPYTTWIPPQQQREFDKQMSGAYVGIGAEIDLEQDRLRIISPLEGSPALEAGVLAGDVVMSIDGTDTLGLSTEECIDLLLGEEGATVTIVVRRSEGEDKTIEIVRRRIETRSVRGLRRDGESWVYIADETRGIGYVKLTQFTQRSIEELREVLDEMASQDVIAMVLDLRFNGGGTLDGAIDVADLFLDRGMIVSVRDRAGDGRSWTAASDDDDCEWPMVVLVNDASASASEIVAGALQSHGRAKILGERTYGKGSVQEVRVLPQERGTLKITTARYYLPDGRNLDRHPDAESWGVDPDAGYVIDLDNEAYSDMIESRRRLEPIAADTATIETDFDDPDWIEREYLDPQLSAAIRALQDRLDGRPWPRVGDDPSVEAQRTSELAEQIDYRKRLLEELETTEAKIRDLESGVAPATESP